MKVFSLVLFIYLILTQGAYIIERIHKLKPVRTYELPCRTYITTSNFVGCDTVTVSQNQIILVSLVSFVFSRACHQFV